ncbi:MAG: AsmA family protein, partial [Chloroflexota bacterium]
MKRPTRLLAIAGTLIVLVLALLFVLPLLFRDRIAQRVKAEVNRSLAARVDWRDAGLTLFRDFPNLTLTLDDLTTVGVNRFQGDTLAAVRHLRVVLDLASVLGNVMGGRPIVVRAVELDQPRLRLIALEDGTANWDITKETPARAKPEAAAKPIAISLRRFEITDGAIAYDDRHGKINASLAGYDQSLSGDFSQDLVGIKTKAEADT